jgi:hypothetical protein
MSFEQATIKIEKEKEFEELKAAIERAFRPEAVERFLKRLQSKGLRVRDFGSILSKQILDGELEASAQSLHQALTVSDQAQMREFYLSKLEGVEQTLRHRFKKLYQYY